MPEPSADRAMTSEATQTAAWSWRRRSQAMRQAWTVYRWAVATVAFITAFTLGFIGYGQQPFASQAASLTTAKAHPPTAAVVHLSFIDRIYDTLLLFRFSTAAQPPLDTDLELARWLALFTVAYAAAAALRALFVQQWAEARVRFATRNHVIVCGAGKVGTDVANDFRRRGLAVVMVDRSPLATGVTQCRAAGIPCLVGDASDELVLLRARLDRARYVVATCGNDDINIDIVMTARAMATGRGWRLQRCWAHIDDGHMCELLEASALTDEGEKGHIVEFFNLYRKGPAAVMDQFGSAFNSAPRPVLIVVGQGHLATNLVLEAARRWRGRRVAELTAPATGPVGDGPSASPHGLASGPLLDVVLLSRGAPRFKEALIGSEPALGDLVSIYAVDADPSESDVGELPVDVLASGSTPMAFICLDDDASALRAAIRVRKVLAPTIPIVVSTSTRSGVASLLGEPEVAPLDNVTAFALDSEISWDDFLMSDRRETLARAIHADYHRRTSKGPGSEASVPWDDLAETYKRANRDQAADIERKLSAVGCRMVPTVSLAPPTISLTRTEIEKLAIMEHERWMAERLREGWTHGEVKDTVAKKQPALVPWDQLSEPVKDLDRDTVRNIPAFLSGVGYAVIRRTASAPPPVPRRPAVNTSQGQD